MAADLPDLVDCDRLGEEAAQFERVYELAELPRLRDLLAEPGGKLHARFAFAKAESGRARAGIVIRAVPQLVCQRCMHSIALPVSGGSEVEFTGDAAPQAPDAEQEFYFVEAGMLSLRELAEEELLLALPLAAACSTPQSCGNAPNLAADAKAPEGSEIDRRALVGLQDLLKKT